MKLLNLASYVLIVLMLSAFVSAADSLQIVLRGPSDNSETGNEVVEFKYGFNQAPDVKSCSLIIDGEVKQTRSSLINFDNNKISQTLSGGTYDWKIMCVESPGLEVSSETRTVTIDVEVEQIETYETIYNNNGFRSYAITPRQGQDPIVLPAMKIGEDIQILTPTVKHYFDLVRMGSQNNVYSVELRHRPGNKLQRIPVNESRDFDLDEDEVIDVSIKLENVERGVNAYIVVTPFPGKTSAPKPVEVPEQEETQAETPTPVETTPPNEEEETGEPEPVTPAENNEVVTAPDSSSSLGSIILAIIAVLVLAVAAAWYFYFKKPSGPQKEHKSHSYEHHEPVEVIKSGGGKKKR